eukprot:9266308-Pyramimonas_sp.AAC.1
MGRKDMHLAFRISRKGLTMEDPEDNWMHYSDYVAKHGDPSRHGHKRCIIEGKDVVIIPGERIGKIRRSVHIEVDMETELANTDDGITRDDTVESMQEGIFNSLDFGSATGVSLSSLIGPLPGASSAGSSGSGQQQPATPQVTAAGFGFSFSAASRAASAATIGEGAAGDTGQADRQPAPSGGRRGGRTKNVGAGS